jgi:hypothetical protein
MSSSAKAAMRPAVAVDVRVTDGRLHVVLSDQREISAPLRDFPTLDRATEAQRDNWEITDFGIAIRWPDIDEDVSVAGLLGVPEHLVEEAAGFTIHNRQPPDG